MRQPINLCVIQPKGYVYSLGLLDQAVYYQYYLGAHGLGATISKNRLRADALNLVFGAHLGFDADLAGRYACVFVNLEQIGANGTAFDPAYLALLARHPAIDYDALNVAAYRDDPAGVPLIPFQYTPYLRPEAPTPLAERPIDLLFIGSINPRRRALFERIRAAGVDVALFDSPLYGPERDAFIAQAKAVLNCGFYDASRFEQTRAAHALSCGTPVISTRPTGGGDAGIFEDLVFWIDEANPTAFFADYFASPAFYAEAQRHTRAFTAHTPDAAFAALAAALAPLVPAAGRRLPTPAVINLATGPEDYRMGWLNIDANPAHLPDLVLDLGARLHMGLIADSPAFGEVVLAPGGAEAILSERAHLVTADLPCFMTHCLDLLKVGGNLILHLPEGALAAGMLAPFTDSFWQSGWFAHRFAVEAAAPLPEQASQQVILTKVLTTPAERNRSRAIAPGFALEAAPFYQAAPRS